MEPEDVWVILNTQSMDILHVYAIESLAKKKERWYHESKAAPYTGTINNYTKIKALTLSDALHSIAQHYLY